MNTAIIRTEQLSRSFGSVQAVNELTLEIPAGIVFAFLGPNGAGKTTTIQLLLGLLEPSHGCSSVLGFDTRTQADKIREHTGALLEFSGLYERMSAEDNLDFYGRIYQMPVSERRARIKELLTHLDLWDRRGERVGTWSRGMKQQLAVARALLHHPQLVFLDEPVAGLDPIAASRLNNELASLVKQEGVTVFLSTHNMADAQKLAGDLRLDLYDSGRFNRAYHTQFGGHGFLGGLGHRHRDDGRTGGALNGLRWFAGVEQQQA